MKILHLNAGNETGGGMHHILRVVGRLNELYPEHCILGLMEKKELYERAVENNIHTVHFGGRLQLGPVTMRRIAVFIREQGITHVHTHGPRANVYMKWLQKFIRVHWVATVHSNPLEDFKNEGIYGRVLQSIHLNALRSVPSLISVSQTFRKLLGRGRHINQIRVIHNGIDFHKQDVPSVTREELGFTSDDFLIVQVARLHPVKAHSIALQAMKQVAARHSSAHLLLVGDGPLRAYLVKLAEQFQIADRVHFIGETESVDAYYKLADVTLLTSLSESFPYVLLESARMQTPVITTEVGDVDLLLNDEEQGWKVKVNDVSAIAASIQSAIARREKGELSQIGKKLHKAASSHFSLDKCVQEVYNVYKDL